jgi:class 3 adenylate cyclase
VPPTPGPPLKRPDAWLSLSQLTDRYVPFEATSLCFDVRNSTDLIEEVGPQVTAHIFAVFFEAAVPILERCGAVIGNWSGDGAIALFRDPSSSVWALRAALSLQRFVDSEMRDRLPSMLGACRPPPIAGFSIGIGIDRGGGVAVAMGNDQSSGISWVGTCINTASRLAGVAPGGSLLVTREVFQAFAANTPRLPLAWSPEETMEIGRIAPRKRYVRLGTPMLTRVPLPPVRSAEREG